MKDFLRESLSYSGLYRKMFRVKRQYTPVSVSYGSSREQYFLYYEPEQAISDKVIVWVHGGGWNAGSPRFLILWGSVSARRDIVSSRWATDWRQNINTPASSRTSVRDSMPRSAI